MATDTTIAHILTEIADSYPSFVVTPERVKVWHKYLKDYDDGLLVAALEYHISTSTTKGSFAPAIPEIRSAATQVKMLIANIPTSLEGWEDVLQARRPHKVWYDKIDPETGESHTVIEEVVHQWIHPLVEKVAVMLGWPDKFPVSDEVSVDRAHFIKAYDAAIGKAITRDMLLPEVKEYIIEQKGKNLPDLSDNQQVIEITGKLAKRLEKKR